MMWRAIPALSAAILLLLAGCTKESQQPQYTQVTISIYNSPTYDYDSVFASVTQGADTVWLDRLGLAGTYYEGTVHLNPGSGYVAHGWAYAQGLRCFNSLYNPTFSLAEYDQKRIQVNLDPQPPTPPANVNATTNSSTQITVTWEHSGVLLTGFEVQRSRATADSFAVVATPTQYVRSFQNVGLDHNTWYYYRVRAHNPAGYSAYSNIDSAKTNP